MFKYISSIWITMALSALINITDFFFLGQIDARYYAIVGIASIPFSILTSLLVGFGVEVNRQTSIGNRLNLLKIIGLAFFICLVLVVGVNIFSNIFFLYLSSNIPLEEVKNYFTWLSISAFPLVVIFIGAGLLRGQGKAPKQIPFSILAVSLNAIFDFLLIKKATLFSPLISCAVATIIADTLVAVSYLWYCVNTKQMGAKNKLPSRFIINMTWASVDKLFSVGSLVIISQMFVGLMPLNEASLYFAFQAFLMPFVLWAHAYFEWIIHRQSQKLAYKDRFFSMNTILVFLISSFLLAVVIKKDFYNIEIFAMLYFLYLTLFWKEREFCATLFSQSKGNMTAITIGAQKIFFFVILISFLFFEQLNLISFMLALDFTMLLQNIALQLQIGESRKLYD